MKKIQKKLRSLPKGATEEQIIRWTTTQDPLDRVKAGMTQIIEDHSDLDELLQEALFQGNKAQLNMRIPPAMKAVLTKLAKERTTDATTLGRVWLAERIQKELSNK